eukprot:scaffold74997_cov36-Cyclotella_meneghiniana.AAC.1
MARSIVLIAMRRMSFLILLRMPVDSVVTVARLKAASTSSTDKVRRSAAPWNVTKLRATPAPL